MSFGKRRQESTQRQRPGTGAPSESQTQLQQLEALRDDVMGLLDMAGRMADAVRGDTAVAMPVVLDEPDPTSGPLVLKGFHTHFIKAAGGKLMHRVVAYRQARGSDDLDPNAQFHLHQLTGRAMELNLFCQRAHMDEALGVALQSSHVPAMIDAILVPAAFFTALLDNMAAEQQARETGAVAPGPGVMKANLDRHLLMATDRMLDPTKLQALLPMRSWPVFAAEIEMAPHDGDYFINGVYFPAEHARLLLDAAMPHASAAA